MGRDFLSEKAAAFFSRPKTARKAALGDVTEQRPTDQKREKQIYKPKSHRSRNEVESAASILFDRLDANCDGVLSREEFTGPDTKERLYQAAQSLHGPEGSLLRPLQSPWRRPARPSPSGSAAQPQALSHLERAEWRDARRNLRQEDTADGRSQSEEETNQHRMAQAIRLLRDPDDEPPHAAGQPLPGDALIGSAVIEALSRHVAESSQAAGGRESLSPRSERLRSIERDLDHWFDSMPRSHSGSRSATARGENKENNPGVPPPAPVEPPPPADPGPSLLGPRGGLGRSLYPTSMPPGDRASGQSQRVCLLRMQCNAQREGLMVRDMAIRASRVHRQEMEAEWSRVQQRHNEKSQRINKEARLVEEEWEAAKKARAQAEEDLDALKQDRVTAKSVTKKAYAEMTDTLAEAATSKRVAALHSLKHLMLRLSKTPASMRLEVWRMNVKADSRRVMARRLYAMEKREKGGRKKTATRMLNHSIIRQLKGEAGMRVLIWRSTLEEEKAATAERSIRDTAASEKKGSGMRQLKLVLIRLAKGEASMRLEAWRAASRRASEAQTNLLIDQLHDRFRGERKGAGLRQMKLILLRIMKGKAAMRLEVWRSTQQRAAQEQLRRVLQEKVESGRKGSAVSMLRSVFAGITRGNGSMRLELWRTSTQIACKEASVAMRRSLVQRAADDRKGAAMRRLKQIMIRIAKGDGSFRVAIWRDNGKRAERAAAAKLQREITKRAEADSRAAGMRNLGQIIIRRVKGEAGMRIAVWRTTAQLEATDQRGKRNVAAAEAFHTERSRDFVFRMAMRRAGMIWHRRTSATAHRCVRNWCSFVHSAKLTNPPDLCKLLQIGGMRREVQLRLDLGRVLREEGRAVEAEAVERDGERLEEKLRAAHHRQSLARSLHETFEEIGATTVGELRFCGLHNQADELASVCEAVLDQGSPGEAGGEDPQASLAGLAGLAKRTAEVGEDLRPPRMHRKAPEAGQAIGRLTLSLEAAALGGAMVRGIDLEERARRKLRRRHAGQLATCVAHACGGLAEACRELRNSGHGIEASSVESLELEALSPGGDLGAVVPQLEALAGVLRPSPHQSHAWRALSCAAGALRQGSAVRRQCMEVERGLDEALSAAGEAVLSLSRDPGGIETAVRLQRLRGEVLGETVSLAEVGRQVAALQAAAGHAEAEAEAPLNRMRHWIEHAAESRAGLLAGLSEAAEAELERRGERRTEPPAPRVTPGFPSAWRHAPSGEGGEEEAAEGAVWAPEGEWWTHPTAQVAFKLETELSELRQGKRSVEALLSQALDAATARESELGEYQGECRQAKLNLGDLRTVVMRMCTQQAEGEGRMSLEQREVWAAEMADLTRHAKLLCAHLTQYGSPTPGSPDTHGAAYHPTLPDHLADSIAAGATPPGVPPPPGTSGLPSFASVDTNGDGVIDQEEFRRMVGEPGDSPPSSGGLVPRDAMEGILKDSAEKIGLPALGSVVPKRVAQLCELYFGRYTAVEGSKQLTQISQVTALCKTLVHKLQIPLSDDMSHANDEAEVKARVALLKAVLKRRPIGSTEFIAFFGQQFLDYDTDFVPLPSAR